MAALDNTSPLRAALVRAKTTERVSAEGLRRQLEFLRAGGDVERYHSTRTLASETVAHHSFGVAWLCWLLAEEEPRGALLMAALAHDIAEHIVGDIPAPTKRALGVNGAIAAMEDDELERAGLRVPALSDAESRLLKTADVMDGMLFCIRERGLGNTYIRIIYERYAAYLRGLHPTGRALELAKIIYSMWNEVSGDNAKNDGK